MRVIELEEILTGLDESAALEAVARGFQRHARGEAVVQPPMHLACSGPQGDCHVKAAALAADLGAQAVGLAELCARADTAPIAFGDEETVVADLTGVAVQDFEIATSVWRRLSSG